MWTQPARHAVQCEGIENLKTAQSERIRRMIKLSKAFLCRGLNSPNERLWNARVQGRADIAEPVADVR
jgi:hypothetical protein